MRKKTFGSWVALIVKLGTLAFMATALSFLLFTLANFSDNANKFFFAVKTNDSEMSKRELIGLHYFYDLSRRWKVQGLADKYLFRDASFYEVADSYLIRDWEKVMNDLKEKLDDSKSYPYGNAKFRQVKALYQVKNITLDEALKTTLTEVATDFEKALRSCLELNPVYGQCFDRVWNYDLATNKKDAEEALKSPPPQVLYILGPPKKDGIPILPPPIVPGGGKEEEEKPGAGEQKRRP